MKNTIYITNPVSIRDLIKSKIFIDIQPVDDWNQWSYRIYFEDDMSPFFEAKSSDEGCELKSYDLAFDSALQWLIDEEIITIVKRIF